MITNGFDNNILRGKFSFENESQFLSHTIRHIENVEIIALNMLENLENIINNNSDMKAHFGIPKNASMENFKHKFKEMISIHDISKTSTDDEFLKKHELDEPIYKTLSRYAGVKLEESDRSMINKLNSIDDLETKEKALLLGLEKWELDLYEILEHSADIVERGCNPITAIEMNKNVIKASEIHSNVRPKPEQSLIKKAEDFYNNNLFLKQLIFANKLFTESPSFVVNIEKLKTSQEKDRKIKYH